MSFIWRIIKCVVNSKSDESVIPAHRPTVSISGSEEDMECLIAYSLQRGMQVDGLLPGESEKYLAMDLASDACG